MRAPRDYDFKFTAKGIEYYLGVNLGEDYELQIIKKNPVTQDWDNIVVGWGTSTLYDLESEKYTVEEMVNSMCKVFNKRILGLSDEDDEDQIPEGLPDAIRQLMIFIRDNVKFDEKNGLKLN